MLTMVRMLLGLQLLFSAVVWKWVVCRRFGIRNETVLLCLCPIRTFVALTCWRKLVKLPGCLARVVLTVRWTRLPRESPRPLFSYRLQRRHCFPSRSPGPVTMDRLRLRYIWLDSCCRVNEELTKP